MNEAVDSDPSSIPERIEETDAGMPRLWPYIEHPQSGLQADDHLRKVFQCRHISLLAHKAAWTTDASLGSRNQYSLRRISGKRRKHSTTRTMATDPPCEMHAIYAFPFPSAKSSEKRSQSNVFPYVRPYAILSVYAIRNPRCRQIPPQTYSPLT